MNNNPNMNPIILFFRKYIAGADPGVGGVGGLGGGGVPKEI
jgi:hypothetical protein